MITWTQAHTRAAVMAAEVHADLAIPLDRPVDVFTVIERLGLVLAFAPLGRVSGLYLPSRGSPGIILHDGHPRTRQRYTAGHELGHHVFHHAVELDADLEQALHRGDVDRWPDHEKEAEAFGAWLLMPRRLMRRGLEAIGVGRPRNPYDVYALSLWLGTSYTATARQLSATRIVDSPIADRWARIPPRRVKTALMGELAPDDLHNDVWWLDRRQSREIIEARPGDRMVLTLDEVPSTGYSWELAQLPSALRLLADSYENNWEPQMVLEGDGSDVELDGPAHPRCLALELDRELERRETHRLSMVKSRSWATSDVVDEFEVIVQVNPPLHGVQLQEPDLALSR